MAALLTPEWEAEMHARNVAAGIRDMTEFFRADLLRRWRGANAEQREHVRIISEMAAWLMLFYNAVRFGGDQSFMTLAEFIEESALLQAGLDRCPPAAVAGSFIKRNAAAFEQSVRVTLDGEAAREQRWPM